MKNFVTALCLIFLILFTAIIKTSSKKIEEEIFILEEKIISLKDNYKLVLFEHTYLSKPSRLIDIMRNNKNIEYIHLNASDLKNINTQNNDK